MKSIITNRKIAIVTALCFFVGGCATNTLKEGEANKYKGVSINDFLKDRFPYKRYESSGLLDGNLVMYAASFNKVNYQQLYRPYKEVSLLCKVNGGKLENIEPYNKNPIKPYILELEQEGQPLNPAAHDPNSNRRARLDPEDNKVLFSAIRKDKIFGLFSCNKNGHPLWKVRMIPVNYYPSLNMVTTLYIAIKVEP